MIHKTAIIDDNTIISSSAQIWHFSHISENAKIGDNCVLGQNVFIGKNVHIGNNVKIQNNVSIFEGVELEDDVFCGPSCVFTNVIKPRSFVNQKNNFSLTVVKKGSSIGANSTIICGNSLGEYSFIGAGSLVNKNVKKFSLVFGNPAIFRYWIDKRGEKLNFDKKNKIKLNKYSETYILKNDEVSLLDE